MEKDGTERIPPPAFDLKIRPDSARKKNPKTFKKRLDIMCRPDKNAVI
jgi:hypothetical protein